ncbi:thioredoxin-like protein [Chloropicon primus]|uniref:Thioredoxin-like protein n=1 Tax=Chloropicon primus TaxID=1764295 RepID=A0A5B8MIV2_9CHLO|nr:thioredoxin-like protein [Chloropicon primus]|mmetsp:Transcript_9305/g.26460  ORF Transcript_9305/g.26460 Transcript_9305/m.26460 type:complete len:186 (+) Transcript_9305:197-754(+)|eukprot:QDZ20034.1 thioredoxin-like protein [Chloropicon primus]
MKLGGAVARGKAGSSVSVAPMARAVAKANNLVSRGYEGRRTRRGGCGVSGTTRRLSVPESRRTGAGGVRPRDLACGAGMVQKLTTQELEVAISSRDKPMVIDFFATWCGPCVMLSKVLEQLAVELGDSVQFVKVDTDEEVELASFFQIQGLPTLMVLGKDNGGKVLRAEGLLPPDQIKQMIQEVS